MEVNALAPFGVGILPVKQGKKVVAIKVGWWRKDVEAINAAWSEAQRSRVGRKARIAGTVDFVLTPKPSVDRIRRRATSSPKTSLLTSLKAT